ncbi:MAG TPA: hypothetical protein VEW47_11760 [Candidatus Dormibacteraeota bacterium]|nr:hypothetical protein [Candidatus Dormibacteraeota bacterium]
MNRSQELQEIRSALDGISARIEAIKRPSVTAARTPDPPRGNSPGQPSAISLNPPRPIPASDPVVEAITIAAAAQVMEQLYHRPHADLFAELRRRTDVHRLEGGDFNTAFGRAKAELVAAIVAGLA